MPCMPSHHEKRCSSRYEAGTVGETVACTTQLSSGLEHKVSIIPQQQTAVAQVWMDYYHCGLLFSSSWRLCVVLTCQQLSLGFSS